MLSDKQTKEIREAIEKAENPLFFFDDDIDGLCSYILFHQKYQKGKGVVIKSTPVLDMQYHRKIEEYSPDLVVVLDKPMISQEFVDKTNIPIIWIDHHTPVEMEGVRYYNPRVEKPDIYLPTSYMAYQVTQGQMWIAFLGCIGDAHLPDFTEKFREKYHDMIEEKKEVGEISYQTKAGKMIKLYNFILKGKTSDVNKSIGIISKIESPYELLKKETARAKYLLKRSEKIEKEYNELIKQAEKFATEDNFLVFTYPSKKLSLTALLCNELAFKHPEKIVIVGREKDGDVRMGLRSRSKRIDIALKEALVGIRGYGGGHEFACGGSVNQEDFNKFIEQLRKAIQEQP
jgi:single-stranded DNA-specific DHH superfamily exonuclease